MITQKRVIMNGELESAAFLWRSGEGASSPDFERAGHMDKGSSGYKGLYSGFVCALFKTSTLG